jgi:hypothetical protein
VTDLLGDAKDIPEHFAKKSIFVTKMSHGHIIFNDIALLLRDNIFIFTSSLIHNED